MIALHGTWSGSLFHLWGESLRVDGAPPSPVVEQTQEASDGAFLRHPSALDHERLTAAVGDLTGDMLLATSAQVSAVALWVPTEDGVATQSVDDAAAMPGRTFALRPWRVSTLAFTAADAVDLLLALPDKSPVPVGHSLRYFARLTRWVLSMIARQQFVPDITRLPSGAFTARWKLAVCDKRELAWLEAFMAAMPPVCRATIAPSGAAIRPSQVVNDFLAHVTDGLIRRSLENDSFFQQVHARAQSEPAWELKWLAGLVGEDRTVAGPAEQSTSFASLAHTWIGQVDEGVHETPPKLAFTLLEPLFAHDPDDDRWRVRFDLLNPDSDRPVNLLSLWAAGPPASSSLARRRTDLRVHYLSELNRAAELFPAIQSVLSNEPPLMVELDTQGAFAFLRQFAPLLAAQNFVVKLPDWATDTTRRLGVQLHVSPRDNGHPGGVDQPSGLNALLDFDWRVAVGEHPLTAEEFERIVAAKSPLVKINDQWVDIDQDAAARAMEFLKQQEAGQMTLGQAMRVASGAEEIVTGLPVVGLSGSEWIDRLLDTSRLHMEEVEQPEGFRGSLRPYQRRGLNWLAFLDKLGIGGCLADDMGLGKTIQLISLLVLERTNGAVVGPTLLFAPMSIVGNWHRECQRFAPQLKVLVHHGPLRLTGEAFIEEARRADVVVTTYGLARRDLEDLKQVQWHRLVLDEAQKVKNPSTNQSVAIRALSGPRRIALTGTPLENHLSELWSIMEMLNPGLLGGAANFRKRFAIPVEKLGDQQRAAQLRNMIRPFVLRRLKTDPQVIRDLPEKLESKIYCNLTPEQAALYEATVNRMLAEVDAAEGIRRRGLILATLTRLKQIANHPSHFLSDDGPIDGRSGKCERLVEMLEEVMEEGGAALVFTQYRVMGELLQKWIAAKLKTKVPFLHGGSNAKQRNQMINEFQDSKSDTRIFLLSLKAGGLGLNLTRANHVFHFDRWWNPAVESQATDRAYRIGQTRSVHVHKFVCIGTVEDRIDQLLEDKAQLAENIVGSGDEWLTGLSTAELRDYLMLSPDAVSED